MNDQQINLVHIGRLIERKFPNTHFDTMEQYRKFLNENLGTNIQTGMLLPDAEAMIRKAIDDNS